MKSVNWFWLFYQF